MSCENPSFMGDLRKKFLKALEEALNFEEAKRYEK